MISTVVARVAELLGPAVHFAYLGTEKHTHDAPPRVTWEPGPTTYDGPQLTGGGNPRALDQLRLTSNVVCWGIDLPQAERLAYAVVTAVRQAVKGRNYLITGGQFGTVNSSERGAIVTMTIALMVPVPEQSLPFAAPGADRTKGTALITEVTEDPSGATAGNGILETGED